MKILSKLFSIACMPLLFCALIEQQAHAASSASFPEETGGEHETVVQVRTPAELRHQLCRSTNAQGTCTDDDARTVQVVGTIDFRGSEGVSVAPGCFYDKNNPQKAILISADPIHTCVGEGITRQSISFDSSGLHPLVVGSNKTLLGVGSSAIIAGKGLVLKHVRNVVIRNLTLRDINPAVVWAGDAIELNDVDRVWIDHNRFSMVGRQMIVAHFGPISKVDITWNEFDGRTPYLKNGHYWNILFNSSEVGQVNIASNWFHDFSGRSPALHKSGNFYLVSNLFERGRGHALEADEGTKTLMEGNVFVGVDQPIVAGSGKVFAPLDKDAKTEGALCTPIVGHPCVANSVFAGADLRPFHAEAEDLIGFRQEWQTKVSIPTDVQKLVRSGSGPTLKDGDAR